MRADAAGETIDSPSLLGENVIGRGERASASLTQQSLRFLMINRTPIEGRDEWLATARRLA